MISPHGCSASSDLRSGHHGVCTYLVMEGSSGASRGAWPDTGGQKHREWSSWMAVDVVALNGFYIGLSFLSLTDGTGFCFPIIVD